MIRPYSAPFLPVSNLQIWKSALSMFSEKEDIRTYHNLTGSEQFLEEEQEAKVKFFYVVL